MSGKSAHGRSVKVYYYEHSNTIKRISGGSKCYPHRVQAKILEPLVWRELVKVLTEPETAKTLHAKLQGIAKDNSKSSQLSSLKTQLNALKKKQEALTEHLASVPAGLSATPIYQQTTELQNKSDILKEKIHELEASGTGVREQLSYSDYAYLLKRMARHITKEMKPEVKAKVVRALIAKVTIHPDHIVIYFTIDPPLKREAGYFDDADCAKLRRSNQKTNVERVCEETPYAASQLGVTDRASLYCESEHRKVKNPRPKLWPGVRFA